jgi:hypothetical protein
MPAAAWRPPAMAEPLGAIMKSGEPSRTVDGGNDCPVITDDQDAVTGLIDHRRRNAGRPQLREARPRNRNRGGAGAGVAVAIRLRKHKFNDLISDAALVATRYGVFGHVSKLFLWIEVVHLSGPPVPNR